MAEGHKICEGLQVSAIIEKLSPTWKEYTNNLKYQRKEISLEGLIIGIRFEEDNRNAEHRERLDLGNEANLVDGNSIGNNFVRNLFKNFKDKVKERNSQEKQ